ncbi:MAG: 30S ribosomal protein S17 [Candidatus Nealsonbacteria bacterium CG23_combo_of_CG06-09_8_20_14_all_40_13]|uniref:30S ribosomal protein S17 n=1 Tax=Candidatus Nealsonbacteria bacterium CG23_combo_of_CG06-09_8_20_14_all_40_13 TaxID=1974724 RepID=A0A2G9YQV2_9BACT|nr:MAG: 30S ribosomal protein S17 [Candidatus Nealsonbacteria bacterium CG23_combo_of_CG06-09_8_20_14_all_40_13]PIR71198.1 MAG: 30S ribosomal protein S17 [Candidatus Nealsonbacteria bacterium CG10_big_fil_rev_8_21_14_0_10_40_24]PIU43438.1 MAG: 30S ribosomal protein S17 [Candidatus Nealsonbacteria bacterium CG07_land_8_20_14_0_80_40_10]
MSKKIRGKIISDKMDKTVIVEVTRVKENKLYGRKYLTDKSFQADTGDEKYQIGEIVEIAQTRPISKHKHFKVVKRINNEISEHK